MSARNVDDPGDSAKLDPEDPDAEFERVAKEAGAIQWRGEGQNPSVPRDPAAEAASQTRGKPAAMLAHSMAPLRDVSGADPDVDAVVDKLGLHRLDDGVPNGQTHMEEHEEERDDEARKLAQLEAEQPSQARDTGADPIVLIKAAPYDSAQKFLDKHYQDQAGRTLHYYKDEWHAYTGTHYRVVPEIEIKAQIYDFLEHAAVWTAPKGDPPRSKLVPFDPNRNSVFDLIDALRARALVTADVEMPFWTIKSPTKGPVIPLANGLLDVLTGHLHSHSSAYFQGYSLPFDYDPHGPEPIVWLKFLESLWPGDQEAIDTLQEIMGLLLTDDTSHQKLMLLVGPIRSGKGTIARVIEAMLGKENVAAPTLSALSTDNGLKALIGRPVAIVADARLSGRADAQLIAERLLSISGEDLQQIGRKYLDDWIGKLSTRFLLLANKIPAIADASGAMASRFVILQLKNSFFGREDHGLLKKLLPELPGIFNFSLKGRDRLAERGHFVVTKSSRVAVQEMRIASSPMLAFLAEHVVFAPAAEVLVDTIYQKWCRVCQDAGRDHPGNRQTFGLELLSAFPGLDKKRRRNGGPPQWHYIGLRLRQDDDPYENDEP